MQGKRILVYITDGDGVESCTAAVEHADGRIELIDWAKARRWSMLDRTVEPAPEPVWVERPLAPAGADLS